MLAIEEFEEIGFDVYAANDGTSALEMLEQLDPLDLLFTDIQMPGVSNGWQLGRRARELKPDIAIIYATGYGSMNGWLADLVSPEVADAVGKCWGFGSDTPKDPGPWEGELRNMWKPTNVDNLWIHGGNLHQSRHYSNYLALQLKARMEGLPTPVFERQPTHHTR